MPLESGLIYSSHVFLHLGVDVGRTSLTWQRGYTDTDRVPRTDGGDVLALSAFVLSSIPTPLARRDLVKEMWNSGANVIVCLGC